MGWTNEQLKAIEAKGSVIVSAAAGSGKTAVLTERIARLIAGGTDIDRFLVVTFTRSAAAEMKKRIGDKLREMAEGLEDAPRLMQASADIGRADISTIDGFCARVLRRHFQGAGLDPAFRAAEEAEAEALRHEAMEELIEESLGEKQFDRLVNAFDGEEGFTEAAFRLYTFLCAQPDPLGWLKAAAEMAFADEDLEDTPMMEEYLNRAKAAVLRRADMLKVRRDEIAEDYPETAKLLDGDIAMVNELVRYNTYAAYAKYLNAMEFPRFAMKGADKEMRDYVNGVRTKLRDEIKEQREKYFALPLSQHAQRLRDIRPLTECLYSFMEKYFALYSEKKREEGLIDYADMEHMALKLLREPAIAKEYRDRFEYVFVDEYQDCNPVQNEIFAALAREDDQFYVGDVKQSIYRFRMAEPALFTEKFDAFERNGGALRLSKNFRSATAVIDYVNSLFAKIMTRQTGGVDYDESAQLTAGRTEKGGAELHILPRILSPEYLEDSPEDDMSALAAAEAEALFAAGRIRELVNSAFTDRDGTERNYRYNDIVVLHSAPASIAEVWVRTLSREGVPAYAEMSGGYFEAIEVQVFLNLLRIIDNPLQDIPLISVLRSPIGGFDTEELILLRTDNPADGFYASLCLGAERDTLLGAKARAFLDRLNKWRSDAPLYDLGDFMAELMDSTGFEDYASALPGGPSRRANLEALLENAAAYSRRGQGIGGFLRFMDRAKSSGTIGAARIASANVVRIMSIHKSKGLEFPVVILAGVARQFNEADKKAHLSMDRTLGIGLRPIRGNLRTGNILHTAVTARLWRHQVAEQMRVLYVALTRASDRLIMIASLRDMELIDKFNRPLTPAAISAARSYADWILPAALLSPGENPLREFMGMADITGTPDVDIHIHGGVHTEDLGSILPYEQYRAFRENALEKGAGMFDDRFGWQYPYMADTLLSSKVSVSDLTGNYPEIPEYPQFLRDKAAQRAVGRGTATHTLMEHISIATHTEDSIRAEMARLVNEGILAPAEAEVISVERVLAFFTSDLGRRMTASHRVERELPFNHRVSARELIGADTDETMLLQGIIDCCFLEDGQWVLIDYKTDFVPNGKAKQAAAKHRRQLILYRNALEALTGAKVKEMYVHFLGIGESVRID